MLRTTIISSLSLMTMSTVAQAQDWPEDDAGFYLKGFVGASSLQDGSATVDRTDSPLTYGAGVASGGAVGYDFANSSWRAELEFIWRTAAVQNLPADTGTGGDYASTSLMLNGFYRIETRAELTPYVGAGVGYLTEIDFDIEGRSGREFSASGQLAYQVMAGAEYAVNDNLSIFGEARYFGTETATLSDAAGNTLRADYRGIDLLTGVTWSF